MTPPEAVRLPAAERRRAVVDAAVRVFSSASYRGATTAEIAREAGVSEPILYRHFPSKRELYFACLDRVWADLRSAWERALAETEDPHDWMGAMFHTAMVFHQRHVVPPSLWIQALAVAGEDAEIKRYLRRHMREIHDFVAEVMRRAQQAGGVAADREADVEAWINMGLALLATFAQRLGGLLDQEALEAIAETRRRWLAGDCTPVPD